TTKSGDGCSADCKTIEKDYYCPTPGSTCVYQPLICGDGVLSVGEQCDDGNKVGGTLMCYGGPDNGLSCFDDLVCGMQPDDSTLQGSDLVANNTTTVSRTVTLTST